MLLSTKIPSIDSMNTKKKKFILSITKRKKQKARKNQEKKEKTQTIFLQFPFHHQNFDSL